MTGRVQFSANLSGWTNLASFVSTNTTLHLLDPSATNHALLFYRAVAP
jgi:hypothetical protein